MRSELLSMVYSRTHALGWKKKVFLLLAVTLLVNWTVLTLQLLWDSCGSSLNVYREMTQTVIDRGWGVCPVLVLIDIVLIGGGARIAFKSVPFIMRAEGEGR